MMKKSLFLFLAVILLCHILRAQSTTLLYNGYLHLGTDSLQLVLVVNQQDDTLSAVLDSPDQFVTDIPINYIRLTSDSLFFACEKLNCHYKGHFLADGSCKGSFTQYGKRKKLTLSPTHERQLFPRPQEPMPPFPYLEEELAIRFEKGGFDITGTLTLPQGETPKALAILVSGSGWQNRDENIFGHKPFKLIADQLTRNGYAVFRYDDAPQAKFAKMTTLDFADMAATIADTLSARDDLRGADIGIIGHSEGALIAWQLAAKRDDIAFVITLAGPARPTSEILLYQSDLILAKSGADAAAIKESHDLNVQIYKAVRKAKNSTQAGEKVFEIVKAKAEKMTEEEKIKAGFTTAGIANMCMQCGSPWFYALMRFQAEPLIQKARCPLLALNGSKDSQVEAESNLAAIAKASKKNADATIHQFEGLNHLFQECESGLLEEYGRIEQTMSPLVLDYILSWLEARFSK